MKLRKLRTLPFIPTGHRVRLLLSAIRERLLGLDFSMPDRMYDRGREDGAMYVASPDDILNALLSCVDTKKYRALLDIGCGKGYVLWRAKQWGFTKIGGVEYDSSLYDICQRNLKRLGLRSKVDITCTDACVYKNYGSYNVFYFFNPFAEKVMAQVMGRIVEQCRGKEIMVIYYRPRYAQQIEKFGFFQRTAVLYDKEKEYTAYVYYGAIPEESC